MYEQVKRLYLGYLGIIWSDCERSGTDSLTDLAQQPYASSPNVIFTFLCACLWNDANFDFTQA